MQNYFHEDFEDSFIVSVFLCFFKHLGRCFLWWLRYCLGCVHTILQCVAARPGSFSGYTCLLPEKQQMMALVVGSLLFMQETCLELWVPNSGLAQSQLLWTFGE